MVAFLYGLALDDLVRMLGDCHYPKRAINTDVFARVLNQKGFWRIDKERDPELRQTVLTLVAFYDLQEKIADCRGDPLGGAAQPVERRQAPGG